jgi:hypothetical protein
MELSSSWEAFICAATQESSTGPHPEPDKSSPYHTILSKIHFNTIHPPTSWFPLWSFLFWLSHQKPRSILRLVHAYYMPCPSHSPWLHLLIIHSDEYKLRSSSLCSFLQPPITSSLFSPTILLSTLFSNTLCSSLNVKDQVSHPYRTAGKSIVLFIIIIIIIIIIIYLFKLQMGFYPVAVV